MPGFKGSASYFPSGSGSIDSSYVKNCIDSCIGNLTAIQFYLTFNLDVCFAVGDVTRGSITAVVSGIQSDIPNDFQKALKSLTASL